MTNCRQLEAQTWAVLLDHELAYAVQGAKTQDARCQTDWKDDCKQDPVSFGHVEATLRRSQAAWVAMADATCDYTYKINVEGSAKNPLFARCQRDLVFARQQFFWAAASFACDCNVDQHLPDLHYDGDVVPFAFRKPAK